MIGVALLQVVPHLPTLVFASNLPLTHALPFLAHTIIQLDGNLLQHLFLPSFGLLLPPVIVTGMPCFRGVLISGRKLMGHMQRAVRGSILLQGEQVTHCNGAGPS